MRFLQVEGIGFTYADTFQVETLITLTQVPGESPTEFSTQIDIESRVAVLRNVMMITNIITA